MFLVAYFLNVGAVGHYTIAVGLAERLWMFPGAIATVSGVTDGCPCEEGTTCDSQVWILAYRDNRYDGLMLSRISNKWVVGPLQTWWFEYDLVIKKMNDLRSEKPADYMAAYMEYREKRVQLHEAFPSCVSETKNDDARTTVQTPDR